MDKKVGPETAVFKLIKSQTEEKFFKQICLRDNLCDFICKPDIICEISPLLRHKNISSKHFWVER